MAGRALTAADLTRDNLAKLRNARQQLSGPLEQWNLAAFRGMLTYLIRSLDGIVEITRQEGKASLEQLMELPIDRERLEALHDIYQVLGLAHVTEEDSMHIQHAEKFYRRMLDEFNYATVGNVIEGLRRREIPPKVVRAACLNAYLHAQVRQAIMEGYGLMPLIPPEQPMPKSAEKPI
ncbi:hypothetical protein HYU40_04805 [Candidatus Woesearchaeota archaeon]|nr:hypothetical protein [Candidatus Woesearchaeota archaeon]